MEAVAVFPVERRVCVLDHPEPSLGSPTQVKVRMLEVGVCGTDRELCVFAFGTAPAGCEYFVLGHESLGQVVEAGPEVSNLTPGDLVVGAVRLPCGAPSCQPCRAGRQDFCYTGGYREHGIQRLHGFMTRYVVEESRYLHRIPAALRATGVLIEPLTIAEKAMLELAVIEERLGWKRQRPRAVVVGAGPVGLLGAMALINAGYETVVYSRSRAPNPKAALAESIGAEYVSSLDEDAATLAQRRGPIDVVYEAAGGGQTSFDLMSRMGPNGVFLLTGVPSRDERISINAHRLALHLVISNQVIVGTVNAGPDAFAAAIRDLGQFERCWPGVTRRLITGRYPLEQFREPIFQAGGIKNVIEIE